MKSDFNKAAGKHNTMMAAYYGLTGIMTYSLQAGILNPPRPPLKGKIPPGDSVNPALHLL